MLSDFDGLVVCFGVVGIGREIEVDRRKLVLMKRGGIAPGEELDLIYLLTPR